MSERLAIVSDIHANLDALDAVLADIDRIGADRIVCLGDMVDVGPRPVATVERLRARCDVIIGGNHDPLDESPQTEFLADLAAWTRDQLAPPLRPWLSALPAEAVIELDGASVWCVHGSPWSTTDSVLPSTPQTQLRAWMAGRQHDVLACGHTHVQLCRRVDDTVIVNVGSVGMPFLEPIDGHRPPVVLPWAEYAMVTSDAGLTSIDLRRVPYDQDQLRRTVGDSGMPHGEQWLATIRKRTWQRR
ncbi:MAG: metallophosphoesterase family protein [Myxococcota bacterium]